MSVSAVSEVVQEKVNKALEQAETLLEEATTAGPEKAAELRAKAKEKIKAANESIKHIYKKTAEKGEKAYSEVDSYVKTNPWSAVGISAAVGLVLGLLIARK